MLLDIKMMIIAALGAITLSGATYFWGIHEGNSACDDRHKAAAAEDLQKRVAEGELIAGALEIDLAGGRDFYRDLERQVSNEIKGNPLYASCILPGSGLFLANSAIAGKPAR